MIEAVDYVPFYRLAPGVDWIGPSRVLQLTLTADDALKISMLLMSYRSLLAARTRPRVDDSMRELFCVRDGIDAMFVAVKDAQVIKGLHE